MIHRRLEVTRWTGEVLEKLEGTYPWLEPELVATTQQAKRKRSFAAVPLLGYRRLGLPGDPPFRRAKARVLALTRVSAEFSSSSRLALELGRLTVIGPSCGRTKNDVDFKCSRNVPFFLFAQMKLIHCKKNIQVLIGVNSRAGGNVPFWLQLCYK